MKTNEPDSYFTVARALRAPELKERSSRFIADLIPVASKEEIEEHIDRIRKEFYDATHHCYAYRIGITGDVTRAADDGEPSGTAGKPILQALTSSGLTDVLCVVTRYFGGTKLGTGGLVRAYGEAAANAVVLAQTKEVVLTEPVTLRCSYEMLPALERFLSKHEIADRTMEYGEHIVCTAGVRRSLIERFRQDLESAFYGNVKIT